MLQRLQALQGCAAVDVTVAAALLALGNASCSTWGCSVTVCGDLVHRMAVCVVIILVI